MIVHNLCYLDIYKIINVSDYTNRIVARADTVGAHLRHPRTRGSDDGNVLHG